MSNRVKYFFNDLSSAGCQALTDKPTRITPYSVSIVDHIYSNDSQNILMPGIVIADMSDHLPVIMIIFTLKSESKLPQKFIKD